jgi:hypothetical protein
MIEKNNFEPPLDELFNEFKKEFNIFSLENQEKIIHLIKPIFIFLAKKED